MNKKLVLSLSSILAIAAPMMTVVACGSDDSFYYGEKDVTITEGIETIQPISDSNGVNFSQTARFTKSPTTGYPDSFNKINSGHIDFAGGFNDIRANTSGSQDIFDNVKVIGVEKNRITNDGIQVRNDLRAADQYAFAVLMQKMIRDSATNAALQINGESLFKVYSHSDYVQVNTNEKISYIDGPNIKKKNAFAGVKSSSAGKVAETQTDYFDFTGKTNISDLTVASPYTDFKMKNTKKNFTIAWIPSNNADQVMASVNKMNEFFAAQSLKITASSVTEYNVAAERLKNRSIDAALLPVNTWATVATGTNFLLQASRDALIASMMITGTGDAARVLDYGPTIDDQSLMIQAMNEFGSLALKALPETAAGLNDEWIAAGAFFYDRYYRENFKNVYNNTAHPVNALAVAAMQTRAAKPLSDDVYRVGKYESAIYGKPSTNALAATIMNAAIADKNFKMAPTTLNAVKYGYTSQTSSASYVFPELWFNRHFTTSTK